MGEFINFNDKDAIHYKVKEDACYISKAFYIVLNVRVDELKGFPNTEVQLCIVHQIRNLLKYVGSANQKQFAKELKSVYQSFTKEEAELELNKLEEKWVKNIL